MPGFQAKVVNFESPASSDDTVTLAFNFQAKAILIFGCSPAEEGAVEGDGVFSCGIAVSTTLERGVNTYQKDAASTTECVRGADDTIIYQTETVSSVLKMQANVTAIGTTTVTLTFTTVHADLNNGRHYTAVAWGGDDLEVNLVEYLCPDTVNGTTNLTGAGLTGKPDGAIVFTNALPSSSPNNDLHAHFSLGFTSGPSDECCIGYSGKNAVGTSVCARTQRTSHTLVVPNELGTGTLFACETVCFTDDGMDMIFKDYTVSTITRRSYFVLYIKGVQFKTFSGNQPTSVGKLNFQNLGFKPAFAMFASFGNVASTEIVTDTRFSLSAAWHRNAVGCHWISDKDDVATSVSKRYFDNAEVVQARDNDGTLQAEARLNGFSSANGGEIELFYTTANAVANQVIGFAIAEMGGVDTGKVAWTANSHLDRKFNLRGTFGGTNTTWTLPIKDDTIDTIVLGPDFGTDEGTVLTPTSNTLGTVTVAGNYADGLAILGRNYTQEIELTRAFLREKETEIIDARVVVRKLSVNHRRSGTYDMEITQGTRTKTKTFATTDAKLIDEDGRDEVLVAGRADNTTIKLKNASPRPSTFVGVEYTLESAYGVV